MSQAIEIKCKILFSSHMKKGEMATILASWSKDLFNPTYSDTLKTQGKIERGENGELYGDFQVKRGKWSPQLSEFCSIKWSRQLEEMGV